MTSLTDKKQRRAELLAWCRDADAVLETSAPVSRLPIQDRQLQLFHSCQPVAAHCVVNEVRVCEAIFLGLPVRVPEVVFHCSYSGALLEVEDDCPDDCPEDKAA